MSTNIKVNLQFHFHVGSLEVNLAVEENVEVKDFPFDFCQHFHCFCRNFYFSLDVSKVQNSDNFRLNEAASFVEEENLEEVADELENYKFAWFAWFCMSGLNRRRLARRPRSWRMTRRSGS